MTGVGEKGAGAAVDLLVAETVASGRTGWWGERRRGGRVLYPVAAFGLVLVAWELVKLLVPAQGVSVGGQRVLPRTSDGALPHVWSVVTVLGERDGQRTVGETLVRTAGFTLGLALLALVLGTVIGVTLAVVMQRFVWVERGLFPYVVVSQTVPLIALAPLVAGWGGRIVIAGQPWRPWMSIVVIAAYLVFFPVTIGMLRGLQSPSRAAVELLHSFAAGWWATLLRLRLPAAVPYLLPALRLAAAAAVIGAVVAEISTGTAGGIGRQIIVFAQQSTGNAARLYAAVLAAALLGVALTALVSLAERALLRYHAPVSPGGPR
ncbi:ABC transporter permease subunit [Nocardia sp. CDC159]|uniref:ABC transporter permease subunit n=1 Tax=Nocardia pulmonis TaxID=2951408 RepID=A0A9X2IYC5_9NOCA|nr:MULTISPECIES: ABC transporter permease subunit [Nocardia]MCM6775509.1 ABC transporter permease subunit [Nocardia pulmonis]MCM6787757.1 ABC transporter permease subunit [Nocardia sp. CDC159]